MQNGDIAAALQHQQDGGLSHRGGVCHGSVQCLHAVVVAGLDVQCVETGTVADDDLQVGVGLDDFAGDGGDADDHGIGLVLFHIGQNVFGLEAAALNDGVACIFQQLAALRHDLLRQ